MSSVTKSILVPMEKYNRLLHAFNNVPSEKEPLKDDKEGHTMKVENDSEQCDDDPVNNLTNEPDKVPDIIPEKLENDSDEIIQHLPKHIKTRATTLLRYLTDGDIHWNREGELIVNNTPIKGSHISDLIRDVFYNRTFEPVGYLQFYKILANLNIPEGLINNVKRRDLFRQYRLGKNDNELKLTMKRKIPNKKKGLKRKWITY